MSEVWNILTVKDGSLSLLKNLSADEARAVLQRIKGNDPWSQDSIYRRVLLDVGRNHQVLGAQQGISGMARLVHAGWGSGPHVDNGWGFDRCEWWGSEGGQLEIWPKPADYDARLAEAVRVAALVASTNAEIDQAA